MPVPLAAIFQCTRLFIPQQSIEGVCEAIARHHDERRPVSKLKPRLRMSAMLGGWASQLLQPLPEMLQAAAAIPKH
jgi:hypothetical protein